LRNKLIRKLLVLLLAIPALSCSSFISSGQENHSNGEAGIYQALEITDGVLTGPGADDLLNSCRSSHFVLFGEAHGVAGIAELVSAAHRSLANSGADSHSADSSYRLVIEAGDWFVTQIATGELDDTLNRNPYSLAFDYDGDLALIEQVQEAGNHPDSIIGVDQEACAIHPFEYLSKEAESYSARQLAKCLNLKALFLSGRYIRTNYQNDLKAVRERSASDPGALEVVDSVSDSMEIFVDHVEGRINKSVVQRESRMMNLFDQAVDRLPSDSRFIFKMGGAHTVRGIGPNGIKTLGEHVANHANGVGQKSLHISIYPWREDGAISLPIEYRTHEYVLVNCRKLLNSLQTDTTTVDEVLSTRLNNVDWIILIPNSKPASKSIIQGKQKRFVRSKLTKVGLVLVPILFLFPIYVTAIWNGIAWLRGRNKAPWLLQSLPVWISLLMIGIIAFQILLILRRPDSASPTTLWIVLALDVFYIVSIVTAVWAGFILLRRMSQDWKQRMIYWMGCLGCTGLAIFIHVWGLGNLLGF